MKKDISFPPVQLGDLTTNDRNLTGGSTQGYVISLWQCEKEGGEHYTSIDLAFQDGSMYFLRIIYFRAHLDFLTKHLLAGINYQRPNVLPNIKYSMFSVNPVNVYLSQ
jgi:hypothetical protein